MRDLLSIDADVATLRARLPELPGIGPWTTEMVLGFGYGDPDAVPTGDVHLPRTVCKALAPGQEIERGAGAPRLLGPGARPRRVGELHGSDARMLELLAPFAGQRFRVTRLL